MLDLEPAMAEIREAIKDPEYIKQLVHMRLLENTHRVCLSLLPDVGLQQRRQQQEKQALAGMLSSMNQQQREYFRERILSIKLDDLIRVRETYLSPDNASIVVITHSADEHVFEVVAL